MQLKVLRICQLSKLEAKEKTWHFGFEATFPNQMWGPYPQDMQSFKKGSHICLKWGLYITYLVGLCIFFDITVSILS